MRTNEVLSTSTLHYRSETESNCSTIDDNEVSASVIQAASTTAGTSFSWKHSFEIVLYDVLHSSKWRSSVKLIQGFDALWLQNLNCLWSAILTDASSYNCFRWFFLILSWVRNKHTTDRQAVRLCDGCHSSSSVRVRQLVIIIVSILTTTTAAVVSFITRPTTTNFRLTQNGEDVADVRLTEMTHSATYIIVTSTCSTAAQRPRCFSESGKMSRITLQAAVLTNTQTLYLSHAIKLLYSFVRISETQNQTSIVEKFNVSM